MLKFSSNKQFKEASPYHINLIEGNPKSYPSSAKNSAPGITSGMANLTSAL